MSDSVDRLKVCICGGGNGAHMMTGLASSNAKKPDVRVLVLYQEEAKTWTQKLGADPLVILRHHTDKPIEEIKGKPSIITKDPSKAVAGADMIIFCVPAFAHQQYFEAIEPHVGANTVIVGLPGQAGFEFQCYSVLKDKAKSCVVLNFETLPWPCRIEEYGRKVNQLGQKEYLIGARVTGKSYKGSGGEDPIKRLQSLLGEFPVLKEAHSYLEILLMTKGFFHPSIMYGKWSDWKDSDKPLKEAPLFYQGLTEKAAECLNKISDEIKAVSRKVSEVKPALRMDNVDTVFEWVVATYGPSIDDKSSLLTAFRTNGAYKGLLHPVVKKDDGVVPDFKYRYMAEDVPFAMAVEKGVAQLAGVDTPVLDEVLTWAQARLGKEYLVGKELKGKDVKDTRAPQAFGFHKLDDLLALV